MVLVETYRFKYHYLMLQIKRDVSKTSEEELNDIVGRDQIIAEFPVVPLDYTVNDFESPLLHVTSSRLIFRYDEIFEVFDLASLEITTLGNVPQFTLWQQFFEGNYVYSEQSPESLVKLKASEAVLRLAINEPGGIIKEFVLRDGVQVAKNYQTWAMAQIILQRQRGDDIDKQLLDMTEGNFTVVNNKTIVTFIGVFTLYFLIKILTLNYAPDLVDMIWDTLFIIALIAMGYWTYLSINKNYMRYKDVYNMYARYDS